MRRNYRTYYIWIACLVITQVACNKDYLDKKPNSGIVVPKTLDDFQRLLDNQSIMTVTPALGLLSSDDTYFINDQAWQASTTTERNAYVWAPDVFEGVKNIEDWNGPYKAIFYSNIILAGVDDAAAKNGSTSDWDQIKGAALFTRAFANYGLLDCFSLPYDSITANDDLGIPIRLSANVDEIVQRSTVAKGYEQVIADVQQALPLLPAVLPPSNRNRPSKPAGYALLSRIYISMRRYDKAELYADSALALYNKLIDYNTVSLTSTTPFTINNDETIIRYTVVNTYPSLSISSVTTLIDSNLVKEYKTNDLRKSIYFRAITGGVGIKRGYAGNGTAAFTGLATDELFLIKAECLARRNAFTQAMTTLNNLLIKRYKTNLFIAATANNASEALTVILKERQKELVFRGLRWSDVRRLNKEGANISMKRFINATSIELPPNSPKYAMPIPDDEISSSGVQQNPR